MSLDPYRLNAHSSIYVAFNKSIISNNALLPEPYYINVLIDHNETVLFKFIPIHKYIMYTYIRMICELSVCIDLH